jgi:formylglycine-generating enzyme required for sulfatase activity
VDKEASSGIETRENLPQGARKKSAFRQRRFVVVVTLCVGLVGVVVVGTTSRAVPARCPEGRVPLGYRCCWKGQLLVEGRCVGASETCTSPYEALRGRCELSDEPVAVAGGELRITPNDWQAEGRLVERVLRVDSFQLDRTEVPRATADEPELPLTGVDPHEAEAHCRQRGGRLPTADEWTYAAAGSEGRRFPWGHTGLVCRRAVYGLERGPCAFADNAGPDAVGSRPDGTTPQGLLDMVGNVAEWARDGAAYVAMGGSWKSELASDLKVWSRETVSTSREDIGFRCAYPKLGTRPEHP